MSDETPPEESFEARVGRSVRNIFSDSANSSLEQKRAKIAQRGKDKTLVFSNTKEDKLNSLNRALARNEARSSASGLPVSKDGFALLYPDATEEDFAAFDRIKAQEAAVENARIKEQLTRSTANQNRNPLEVGQDTAAVLASAGLSIATELPYGIFNSLSAGGKVNDDILSPDISFLAPESYQEDLAAMEKAKDLPSFDAVTASLSDDGRALSQRLSSAVEGTKDFLSTDIFKAEQVVDSLATQERDAQYAAEVGENASLGDRLSGTATQAGRAIEYYLENPSRIGFGAVESLPYMITGAVFSKAVQKTFVAGLTAREGAEKAVKYLATEEGKKAVAKVGTRSNIAYNAAAEGFTNGVSVQAAVMDASPEQLREGSDAYRHLVDNEGYSHKRAQAKLAQEAGLIATGLTGLFAGTASFITGAGAFEGNLFNLDSVFGKSLTSLFDSNKKLVNNALTRVVGQTALAGTSEFVEEAIQGGGGVLSENVAKKATVNDDQDLLEGVGEAAGTGAIIGLGSGGGISGVRSITKEVIDSKGLKSVSSVASKGLGASIQAVNKTAQGFVKRGKMTKDELVRNKVVNKIVEDNDKEAAAKITNPESADYDPEGAISILLSENFRPTNEASQEQVDQYMAQLHGHNMARGKNLQAELDEAIKSDDADRITDATRAVENFVLTAKQFDLVRKKQKTGPSLSELLGKEGEPASSEEIITTFFGSDDNVSNSGPTIEQAEEIKANHTNTPEEVARIDKFIKIKRALVSEATDQSEVQNEVINGSSLNQGFASMYSTYKLALSAKNEKVQKQTFDGVKRLITKQIDKLAILNAVIAAKGKPEEIKAAIKEMNNIGLDFPGTENMKPLIADIQAAVEKGSIILNEMEELAGLPLTPTPVATVAAQTTEAPASSDSVKAAGADENTQKITSFSEAFDTLTESGLLNKPAFKRIAAALKGKTAREAYESLSPAQRQTVLDQANKVSPSDAAVVEKDRPVIKEEKQKAPAKPKSKSTNEVGANAVKLSKNDVSAIENKAKQDVGEKRAVDRNMTDAAKDIEKGPLGKAGADLYLAEVEKFAEINVKARNNNEKAAAVAVPVEPGTEASTAATEDPEVVEEPIAAPAPSLAESLLDNVSDLYKRDNDKLIQERVSEKGNPIFAKVTNYLATLFKPANIKEDLNVLRTIPNFAEKYAQGNDPEVLAVLAKLSDKEKEALRHFMGFRGDVAKKLFKGDPKNNIAPILNIDPNDETKGAKRRDQNIISLFYKNTLDAEGIALDNLPTVEEMLDPNFVTAIAVSLYDWVGTMGESTLTTSDEQINSILGKQNSDYVSKAAYTVFANKGALRMPVEEAIGNTAFEMLGLKAIANTDGKMQKKVKMSLGSLALLIAREQGLIEDKHVLSADIAALADEALEDQSSAAESSVISGRGLKEKFASFIRLKGQERATESGDIYDGLTDSQQRISDNVEAGRDMFSTLFGTVRQKAPVTTKPEMNDIPELMKRSFIKVSKRARSIMLKHAQRPHKFKDVLKRVNMFTDEDLFEMFGGVPNVKDLQVNIQESTIAQNAGIRKVIKDLKTYQARLVEGHPETGLETEFYYLHEMWRNGRIGLAGNVLNMQAEKISRHLIGMTEHTATIGIDPANPYKSPHIVRWYLAIAEGLGVTIKNKTDDEIIGIVNTMISDESLPFNQAIALLQRAQGDKNEFNAEERATIAKAVKATGTKMHGLEALDSMASFLLVINNKESSFTTDFSREVDGINNGVIFSAFQLMLSQGKITSEVEKLLNQGGMFLDKGKYPTYTHFLKDPQNRDVYEDLTVTWAGENTQKRLSANGAQSEKWAAIDNLVGSLTELEGSTTVSSKDGRNYAKPPVMVFVYGASLASIRRAFIDSIIDKIYDDIQKAYETNDTTKFKQLNKSFELLGLSARITKKNIQTFSLENEIGKSTPKDLAKLRDAIDATYGDTLATSISNNFAEITKNRKFIQENTKQVFAMFQDVFESELKKKETELDRDLNQEEQEALLLSLTEHLPLFKTAISFGEDGTGVLSWKEKNTRGADTTGNSFSIKVGDTNKAPISNTAEQIKEGVSIDGARSIKSTISIKDYLEASNKSTVLSIQSMDSATMLETLDLTSVINIFDAIIMGVTQEQEASKIINEMFLKVNEQNSLLLETALKYQASFDAYVKYNQTNNKRPGAFSPSKQKALALEIAARVKFAQEAETLKSEVIAEIRSKGLASQYNNGTDHSHEFIPEELTEEIEDGLIQETVKATIEQSDASAGNSYLTDILSIVGVKIDYTKGAELVYATDAAKNAAKAIMADARIEKLVEDALERQGLADRGIFSSEIDQDIKNFQEDPDKLFALNDPLARTASTTEGIFDLLGQVENQGNSPTTDEHSNWLRSLLTDLTQNFTDKVKVRISVENSKQTRKTWGAAIDYTITTDEGTSTNKEVLVSVGSAARVNGIQMSGQEAYVHEMIHILTKAAINGNNEAKRELTKLYMWVKHDSGLDWKAFLNNPADAANPVEEKAARAAYNYIFNNTTKLTEEVTNAYTGRTETVERGNHLHEFIALGLSNKNFKAALTKLKAPPISLRAIEGETLIEKLFNFFQKILALVDKKYLKNKNKTAFENLRILAQELANLDQKNKVTVGAVGEAFNSADRAINAAAETAILGPLRRFTASDTITKNGSQAVRGVGGFIHVTLNGRFDIYSRVIAQTRRAMGKTSRSFLDSLARELVGVTVNTRVWHQMLSLSNRLMDQNHKAVSVEISKLAKNSFLEFENDEEKKDITRGYIQTDFSLLDNYFTPDQQQQLLDDPVYLKEQIEKYKAKLDKTSPKYAGFYKRMADSLANKMITGNETEHNTSHNAYSIARLYGTSYTNKINSEQYKKAEVDIDILVSLMAVEKTADSTKKNLGNVMRRENARGSEAGGIHFLSQLLKDNKKESLRQLFGGNKAIMHKGYMRELYNPNITYVVAPLEDKDALAADGFVLIDNNEYAMKTDSVHKNLIEKDMHMYVNRYGKTTSYQGGVAAMNQETAAGTDVLKVNQQQGVREADAGYIAGMDIKYLIKEKTALADKIIENPNSRPVDASKDNLMSMVYDPNGNITTFRYTMETSTKDKILERDLDFDTIVGKMEANIDDKVNARAINTEIIEELHKEFERDFVTADKGEFVVISAKSADKELRDIWRMMPSYMRSEIKRVWGEDQIIIRDDIVELVFGRRKMSAADALAQKRVTNDVMEVLGSILAKILGPRGVRIGEAAWQDIIKFVKDVIVVKTGIVLAGNVISNFAILLVAGVPVKDIVKNHSLALEQSRVFMKDTSKKLALTKQISGLESSKESAINKNNAVRLKNIDRKIELIRADIKDISEALATNPVAELNAAGVYQTIVEDLAAEDEKFVFKSQIQEWADPVIEKIPPIVKSGVNHILMGHGTPVYKFLRDGTQMSDFIARYTLHRHNINNKKMDNRDSIQNVVNTFINYDLPTHKYIQYANDMGFIMFTKFALRIQKVILETAKGNPSRALAFLLIQAGMGDVPDIMDTNFITGPIESRFNYNPIDLLTGAVGDMGTIKLMSNAI